MTGSQTTGAKTDIATTPSVVEKVGNTISADDNRAHSDRRSQEDKCGGC